MINFSSFALADGGSQCEEEGAVERSCYGLTLTPIPNPSVLLGVQDWRSWEGRGESEPGKKCGIV